VSPESADLLPPEKAATQRSVPVVPDEAEARNAPPMVVLFVSME
jgi:hypothetical protein